ncbi:MAG: Maf family protein [Chloroflexota bacterium]|nr:Maf family protein [Chloroflexota bacterium]
MFEFIFATSSPRRIEIINKLNYKFDFISHKYEENNKLNLRPKEITIFNALNKAQSISKDNQKKIVFASDTIVYKNEVIGKPKDKVDAFNIINKLNDDYHIVITSIVALKNLKTLFSGVKTSLVETNKISADKINKYIDTGYYSDKAGGYGIQNIDFKFVKNYYGCYENILGLPTCLINESIAKIKSINNNNFSICKGKNK